VGKKGRLPEIKRPPQQENAPTSAAQAGRAKKVVCPALTGQPMSDAQHGDAHRIRDTSIVKKITFKT